MKRLGNYVGRYWLKLKYGYIPPKGFYLKPPMGYSAYLPKPLWWIVCYKVRRYLWSLDVKLLAYYHSYDNH